MRKIYLYGIPVILLGFILMSSIVSGSWEYKTYNIATKTVTIQDTFLGKIVDLKLIENTDKCLINCHAIIEITPYKSIAISKTNSFLDFKDWLGKDIFLQNLKIYLETIKIVEEPIMTEEKMNCKETISLNGTKYTTCDTKKIQTGTKQTLKTIQIPYDFSQPITEKTRIIIEGKKKIWENIEWIPIFLNYEIKEWAWWNASYIYKKQITISNDDDESHIQDVIRLNLSADSDIVSHSLNNFTDIKIVYDDTTEIPVNVTKGYWGENVYYAYFEETDLIANSGTNTDYWIYYGCADCLNYGTYSKHPFSYEDTFETNASASLFSCDAAIKLNVVQGLLKYDQNGAATFKDCDFLPYKFSNASWFYNWNSTGNYIGSQVDYYGDENAIILNYGYDRFQLAGCYNDSYPRVANVMYNISANISIFSDASATGNLWAWNTQRELVKGGTGLPNCDLSASTNTDNNPTTITAITDNDISIDYMIISTGNNGLYNRQMTYSLGAETATNSAPAITIITPSTTAYLNNSLWLNFTATDDATTTLPCYLNLDGTETSLGDLGNGTYYSGRLIPLGEKTHTLNVSCLDEASKMGTSTVNPIIYYWNITGKTYDTSGYELGTSNFQIDFQKVSNISSIEAFLFFNGANESYDSSTISGDIITLSTNKTLDLILTNYTNTSFGWNYSIVYANGTSYDNNSISNAFSVFYSFWIASVSADKSQILAGETFNVMTITGNHTGISEPTTKNITILSNGTFYPSLKINPSSWRSTIIGIDYNESFYYKAIYNLSYGGYSFLRNSSDYTMTAYSLAIDNCSDYATKFLQIDFLNETNKEPINQTIEITFSIWNTSYVSNITEYFDSNSTINLCYYPAWSKFTGDGIIEYYSELYPRRRYYYDNATFDNVSDTLNLYNLPSSLASLINFEIRNEKGILQSDVYLTVQRYYVSDDQYLTVAMGKTDFDGMTSIYLKKNDVWYRYILTKDLQVLRIFTPSYITSDSVALTTQVISYGEWWTYKDNLIYTCYTTNNNQTLVCSMLDTTGTAREGCLVVEEIGVSKNSTRYNSCAKPSSAITFTADLGNTTGKLYHYVLSGNWDNTKYVLMNNMLDFTVKTLLWGMEGIFVSFMLFMVMVGIGLFSPSASIVLGVSAIVISQIAGFTAFTPVGIIGLVVVGIILAFKMRS